MTPVMKAMAILLLVAAVGTMSSPAAAQSPGAERIAQGQALYQTHCARCHGKNLEGQPDWRIRRPNGRLPAPLRDRTGHTWHHPDEHLARPVP